MRLGRGNWHRTHLVYYCPLFWRWCYNIYLQVWINRSIFYQHSFLHGICIKKFLFTLDKANYLKRTLLWLSITDICCANVRCGHAALWSWLGPQQCTVMLYCLKLYFNMLIACCCLLYLWSNKQGLKIHKDIHSKFLYNTFFSCTWS